MQQSRCSAPAAPAASTAIVCHGDGRHHERFWIEYPSSRQHPLRITVEDLRAGKHFPSLDLEHVERFGVEPLPAVVREALAAAETTADAHRLLHPQPHPAGGRRAQRRRARDRRPAKLIDAGAQHGHLTAAALPVALSEARACRPHRLGRARVPGGCGAGYTWGAAVLTL